MPAVDYAFSLPQSLLQEGIRRYGLHGLSYQYIMSVLQTQILRSRGRVVMVYLAELLKHALPADVLQQLTDKATTSLQQQTQIEVAEANQAFDEYMQLFEDKLNL